MFKIDKDVPPPASSGRTKYPFAKMAVGDSFTGDSRAAAAASAYSRRTGIKFTTRTVDGVIRIWRIA